MEMTAAQIRPRLIYCPHPILAAAGREVISAAFLPGESIQAYLDRQGVKLGRRAWALEVDGHPVSREWWGRVRPKPGTLITMRALVQKGKKKNPLSTILSIALMVVAPTIGAGLASAVMGSEIAATTFLFGTSITGAMIGSAVVSIGGSLLINALTSAPTPQLSQVNGAIAAENISPTYALSGGSNRARLFEPLPLACGRHILYPDNGAKFYTEFQGEDQYLYQIFNFGIGTADDLVLSDWRIGENALGNYTDVELFEAGADGKLPDLPGNVDTIAGGELSYEAGWITRTSSAGSTALGADIQGSLYAISDQGAVTWLACTIEAEYRLVGAGSWTPWKSEYLSSGSRKPMRKSWRVDVAAGQYEVRVRRATAAYTSPRQVAEFGWLQLKSYQPDAADYSGQRRVGLRIKASGQLQGQVDQINAVAQRLVPVWDGAAWGTVATRNPAWFYLWFARGGSIDDRLVFGVGLADGRIDIEGIKEWAVWCDARGLTFDAIFDSTRSRAEILNTIARCGRASPSWAKGTLGVVWDQADLPHVAVFGMANIVAGSFEVEYATEALADEVVLNFINPDAGWKQDQVRVVVPGFAGGYVPQRPVTVELFGCANKIMAGKEANLIAASQRYHRRRVRWEASFEGLVAQRGDVVMLSHDLTQWGFSGRLVAATDTTLTLDRAVSYDSGSPYVMVTSPAGESVVRAVVPFVGEADALTLLAALPWNPAADADNPVLDYTYVFDPLATPGRRVKIVGVPKITGAGQRLKYEAVDDDPDYYASESNPYTWVASTALLPPAPTIADLRVTEELIRAGAGFAVTLHVTWQAGGAYDHAAVLAGDGAVAPWLRTTARGNHAEITVPDAGQDIIIRVVALDAAGRSDPVAGSAETTHTIVGKALPPADLTEFTATFDATGLRLAWPAIADIDLDEYEIRATDSGWGDTAFLVRTQATVWRPGTVALGVNTWWIKARDSSGNYSAAARSVQFTVTAAPAPDVRAEVIDNNVLPSWTAVAGTLPTTTYEIRKGASYATAEVLGTKAGLFTALFETEGGVYTYWVTAIDSAGNYGTPGSVSVIVNQPPDYVLKANYFSLFTGTFSNAALDGARVLLPVNTTETFAEHFTTRGWATPADQVAAGYPLFVQPGVASGYYEETFDYGVVLPANKVSVAAVTAALAGSVTFTTDISVSADGSAWTDYPGVSQVYATGFRYVKVRISAAATAGAVAEISSLNVRLDAKLKTISGMLDCASGDSGGTTLYLTDDRTSGGIKEFIDVAAITITAAGTTPLIAIYDFTDAPNPLSLKVLLYTTAGARASATASYTIRGF